MSKGMHRAKFLVPRGDQELRDWLLSNFIRNPITGCWRWILAVDKNGYGAVCVNREKTRVSRVIYRLFVGEIPEKMCVLHRCDNPRCINPDHLFVGSHADNMRDKCLKGRANNVRGHEVFGVKLTEEQVREARRLYKEGFGQRELARMFHVNIATMHPLLHRKTWKHVTD